MLANIRENLNTALDHLGYGLRIDLLSRSLLNKGKRSFIELIKVHALNILPVHPAKLTHVKDSRALRNTVIIKFSNQILQGKNFLIPLRTPAEKCHKVHYRFRHKALVNQVFKGGMPGTLGELLMIFIRNQRAVNQLRRLPAEGIIESLILRAGGKILISTNHMGNAH